MTNNELTVERVQGEAALYRAGSPSALEITRSEDGETTIEGMVVPYNEWTEVDSLFEGHFMERFAAGSLKKSFLERSRDLKGYYEHGRSALFGTQPIMDVQEVWETAKGAFFRAVLLRGLPDVFMDGLRRGLYGASLGAQNVVSDRVRWPKRSTYNPQGIEEITRREVRAHDISLTPMPVYASANVMLRSITDELAVEQLIQNPDKLLQLIRQAAETEAEPTHSEPTAPDAEAEEPPAEPETPEEEPTEPEEEPQPPADPEPPEGSRATQPPPDYLSDETEEEWLL